MGQKREKKSPFTHWWKIVCSDGEIWFPPLKKLPQPTHGITPDGKIVPWHTKGGK